MENKKNKFDLDKNLRVIASSSDMLLFFQFECPHCETLNVYSKDNKREIVLCSDRGCRKIIIIENYKDVA